MNLASADPLDSSDSPAAERQQWLEQEQGNGPQSPQPPDPSASSDQGRSPDAVPSAPPDPTPEESWLASLETLPDGGWQYLTSSSPGSDESVIYVSTHNVAIRGSTVSAWFRWEYMTARTLTIYQTYLSYVARTEIDCERDATRDMAITYYSGSNLQGAMDSQVANPANRSVVACRAGDDWRVHGGMGMRADSIPAPSLMVGAVAQQRSMHRAPIIHQTHGEVA